MQSPQWLLSALMFKSNLNNSLTSISETQGQHAGFTRFDIILKRFTVI